MLLLPLNDPTPHNFVGSGSPANPWQPSITQVGAPANSLGIMSLGELPPLAQPNATRAAAVAVDRMIREVVFEYRMTGSRLMAHNPGDGPVLFLFTVAV
jgi:hypothetical protein